MNKATKRGNKWRVLLYDYTDENGKRVYQSFTADTKAEAEFLASQYKKDRKKGMEAKNKKNVKTLREAAQEYIRISEVRSKSTISGYEQILRNRFQGLLDTPIDKISTEVFQRAVNDEMRLLTRRGTPIQPKTVINAATFYISVLKYNDINFKEIKLPENPIPHKEFPDPSEIMKALKGKEIELPCLLALWMTFTMSEIRGIECSSIKNGVISIKQVMLSVDGEDILKKTGKVDTRLRNHVLPDYIMELINNTETYKNYLETGADGPLIPLTREQIYGRWKTICKNNNWDMTFHDLRAVSASVMLLFMPDKYAAERGGWHENSQILKRHYQQTFSNERLHYDSLVNDYFERFT